MNRARAEEEICRLDRMPALSRREFVASLPIPAVLVGALGFTGPAWASRCGALEEIAAGPRDPGAAATDEDYWATVQQAFTADRTSVNLNNGGVHPSPRIVQEAVKRWLDISNTNSAIQLLTRLPPLIEPVRDMLAAEWGTDAEEIAITRNASESLETCQFGLKLEPGDEVLTTTLDYPRMLITFKQREAREGIRLVQIKLPIPCDDPAEVVRRFEAAITPKTRMILMCHIVNITGQILPVKEVVAMARGRNGGIPVIVDGAHALAQFDYKISDLDCDYYGVSLHKWLAAPHGTGLLYVRRSKIKELWPLMGAAVERADNIRKFEEIGTHPMANPLAIAEAVMFHRAIGGARKEARLRYLRDTWARRLLATGKVKLHTSLRPEFSCGIGVFQLDGVPADKLAQHLGTRHNIIVTALAHPEFEGIRVTPSIYTTMAELDRFCAAVESVARDGLPADAA